MIFVIGLKTEIKIKNCNDIGELDIVVENSINPGSHSI